MLQNAYFLAKIGADTAENEQHFAEILPIGRRVADRRAICWNLESCSLGPRESREARGGSSASPPQPPGTAMRSHSLRSQRVAI